MFGKPVSVNNSYDSIGTGALLLSQTEMGVYRTLEDAARTVSLQTSYHHNKKDHQVYMKYFNVFEKLSHKLKDEFEEIAKLQNL